MNVPEFQKNFDLKDAIYATAPAWKDVKDSTLRNCWHKLWSTLGTEDLDFEGFDDPDAVSTDHVQRLQYLASQAPASHPSWDVDSAEMEEWLNLEEGEPVVQELTDEAIVAMLRTPTQTAEQESDGEEEEKERTTWKQAHEWLTTFLKFTQSSLYYNSSKFMSVQILYNKFLSKKASSCKQADLRQLFARAAQRTTDVSSPMEDDPSPKPSSSGVSCTLRYTFDSVWWLKK